MKRQILRAGGIAALATGGLLAVAGAAHAESGSTNGNQITYIYQDTTTVCGNAVAVESDVRNGCGGSAADISGFEDADLDSVDGILDLDLDYDGTEIADDAGRWFHLESRTWS